MCARNDKIILATRDSNLKKMWSQLTGPRLELPLQLEAGSQAAAINSISIFIQPRMGSTRSF